jgi:molybdopterin converting factor small subunit
MKIKVKLIGPLMYEAGFNEKDIEAPAGTTVGALLDLVAIAKERPKIVIRNGKAAAPEELLQDGDKISVSPIYSGG